MKKVLLSALAVSFLFSVEAQLLDEGPRKVNLSGKRIVFGSENPMNQNKAFNQMWVDYSVANMDNFLTGWPFNSAYTIADTVGPGQNNLFNKAAVSITSSMAGYLDYVDLYEKLTSPSPSFSSLIENPYPTGFALTVDTFYIGLSHQNQTGTMNYLEPQIVSLNGSGAPTTNVLWSTKDSTDVSWTEDANSIVMFQYPVGFTSAANQKIGLTIKYTADKLDTLSIAGGGVNTGTDQNPVIGNKSQYETSHMGLVYLSGGSYIKNSQIGYGNPVGSAGWFYAQNWWIWAAVSYTDNSSIDENAVYGFNIDPIYPNPFGGIANIRYSLTESSDVTFEVMDLTGKVLRSSNFGTQAAGSYTINVEKDNLTAGVYLYSFNVNGKKLTKRMIVQ